MKELFEIPAVRYGALLLALGTLTASIWYSFGRGGGPLHVDAAALTPELTRSYSGIYRVDEVLAGCVDPDRVEGDEPSPLLALAIERPDPTTVALVGVRCADEESCRALLAAAPAYRPRRPGVLRMPRSAILEHRLEETLEAQLVDGFRVPYRPDDPSEHDVTWHLRVEGDEGDGCLAVQRRTWVFLDEPGRLVLERELRSDNTIGACRPIPEEAPCRVRVVERMTRLREAAATP